MKVACYLSGNPIHDLVVRAFFDGVPKEHEKKLINDWSYDDPDIAVVFGVQKSAVPISWKRGSIIQAHRSRGRDVVVCETGYIKRGDLDTSYYATGFNGLNGRADFRNDGMADDRWRQLDISLKPWKDYGEHILLCGQIPWDASVQHIGINHWLKRAVKTIRSITGRKIVFRPHPLLKNANIPEGVDHVSEHSLLHDFYNCWACVAFNSNTCVEAAIEGIPVFSFDEGSMTWPICNKDLEQLVSPWRPGRIKWVSELAYAQWTPDEMRQGLTWNHLFR